MQWTVIKGDGGCTGLTWFHITCLQMKYVDDDSTIFWAVGPNSGVIAARAEHCGREVQLTIPLESAASGEVIL